jgi:hypothetical protein
LACLRDIMVIDLAAADHLAAEPVDLAEKAPQPSSASPGERNSLAIAPDMRHECQYAWHKAPLITQGI